MEYIVKLIMAVVSRLKTLTMNPIRNFIRKLQMMVNINVIANKLLKPVTKKFRELFHIKPKSERDYFSVGKLLIAKKLIIAVIVACCIAVFAYFNFVAEPVEQPVTTSTEMVSNIYFDYDDMELLEYTGRANIRAANGRVVYTGDIKNGVCDGKGILHNQSGVLIYEGDFVENAYSGKGKGYSLGGVLQYEGDYADNVYEGEGTLYYPSGQVQYKGGFSGGFYNGTGYLYDENGSLLYEGSFQNGLYHGTGILFYEDGDKKYEGEFVMGSPQGTGTLYGATGRPYYTGIVADGAIAYESLLTLSVAEIEEMFYEEPMIYYTTDNTCYVYETAALILDLDCALRIITNEILEQEGASQVEGDGWYLPEGMGDVPILSSGQQPVSEDTEKASENTGELQNTKKQKIYYYVNDAEWVAQEEMDKASIKVEGVAVYAEDLKNPFPKEQEYISANGVTELTDCIAIEKIRRRNPTLFGNITFESVSRNNQYTFIKDINYAQALYAELADKESLSYQFCYQIDNAETLYYYKITNINR